MKNKQIRFGIILQYLQMGLSIIINLIYTPIMIRILGDSEYGIYQLVSSIISYLNLLSLGFGASYIRFYSRYKVVNDEEGVKKLNGLFLIVFTIMGIVALIAGLFISFNVEIFFNDTYTSSDLDIARVLMIFLTINLSISFPVSVFISYITSQEKFIFQKLVNIGKTVLSPILSIALLYLGYGSIGMVIVTTVISIIIDTINILFCILKLKMKFSFRNPNFKLLKEIAIFSLFIAINQIIDQINWQTDKIILGKMTTSTVVAIYAVASTINSMYLNFSTAISNVYVPRVNRIVASSTNEEETNDKLTDLMIKVGRLQFFVMILILTGFIFFGKYFIYRWAGENYEDAYYITLLLICPVTIPLIQNLGIEIQRTKNKHQFRSIIYLIVAILNVGISIWFCTLWGVIGTALGTTLSLIIGNIIIMNIYYQKALGINIIKFWKKILKSIPAFIIPVICGICLMIFYSFNSLIDFGLIMIAYTIIYFINVLLFGLNKEEKTELKNKLNMIFHKSKI